MQKRFFSIMVLSISLFACKSVYEKQGDKHLAEGDGLKALQRYHLVQRGNKGSKDFAANLTRAYIRGMEQTSDSLGDPEIILTYRERIKNRLPSLANRELTGVYLKTIGRLAEKLVYVPDPRFRGICKWFIMDAEELKATQTVQRQMAMVARELARIEEELAKKRGSGPVVTEKDMILNQLKANAGGN
ncbi:hypothetical protein ACFL5V_02830 [Fibrobacterota bacterium]